jgi:hypothetical protein
MLAGASASVFRFPPQSLVMDPGWTGRALRTLGHSSLLQYGEPMKTVKKTGARWFRTLSPARSPRTEDVSSLGALHEDGASGKAADSATKASWRRAAHHTEWPAGSAAHAGKAAVSTGSGSLQSIADSCKRQAAADGVNISAAISTLTQLRLFDFNGEERLSQVRTTRLWTSARACSCYFSYAVLRRHALMRVAVGRCYRCRAGARSNGAAAARRSACSLRQRPVRRTGARACASVFMRARAFLCSSPKGCVTRREAAVAARNSLCSECVPFFRRW